MTWTRSLSKLLVVFVVAAMLVAGCGDDDDGGGAGNGGSTTSSTRPDGSGSSSTSAPSEAERQVLVYFVRDEKMGVAARSIEGAAVGRGAIEALIEGPDGDELASGLSTAVPDGTELLDLDIADGLATVDLSDDFEAGGGSLSMQLRVAQVVYTLTQFDTVERVAFRIEGDPVQSIGGEGVAVDPPVDRADFEDQTPAILLESPAFGATVSDPVRLRGTANTFEAAFVVQVLDDDGTVLAAGPAMATSGTGTRGTFDLTIALPPGADGAASVVVFEESAKDGSPINRVEVPVDLDGA